MSAKPSSVAELKCRNVLRAAAIYIAAVWALAQGIAQLAPSVGLTDWATRWFLVTAIIAFPFWIAFAWLYELAPSGLKSGSEIAPEDGANWIGKYRLLVAAGIALAIRNPAQGGVR